MSAAPKPILFSAPMIRAILAGAKTQTRRVVKRNYAGRVQLGGKQWHIEDPNAILACPYGVPGDRLWVRETFCLESSREVGDYPPPFSDGRPIKYHNDDWDGVWWEQPHYRATDPTPELDIGKDDPGVIWRPSIHMPRWASRITLEVTEIRVQRVQEISEEDAIAEGLTVQIGNGTGPGSGYKWNGPGYTGIDRTTTPTFHVAGGHTPKCSCYARPQITPAVCAYRELWDSINGKKHPWSSNPWVWAISFRRVD